MTPIILVDELIKFIKDVVADFRLETNVPGAPPKAPQVISGFLGEKKPTQQQSVPDFPFVIVRLLNETDTANGSIAQVKIIAGTYSQDTQNGWRDCLNILIRIRQALLEQQFFESFTVEFPIEIELLEEQPVPEWVAVMTVNVNIPQPVIERSDVFDVFR